MDGVIGSAIERLAPDQPTGRRGTWCVVQDLPNATRCDGIATPSVSRQL